MDKKEKYFVSVSDNEACRIHFDKKQAFKDQIGEYIDSFDKDGLAMNSYKLVNGKYTTNPE